MFRRLSLPQVAAAASAIMASCPTMVAAQGTSLRRIVVFSQQSHILEGNQKARGSPSNVWVEDWEVDRLGFRPEPSAVPTSLVLDKQLELYNFDQLVNPPEVMDFPKHSSYNTRKPYGDKMQFELNDRAEKHGFQSKWWLTRAKAHKDNLQFKANARSAIVLMKAQIKLFHSSQLVGGDALMTYPVSGGSRRVYSKKGESFQVLADHIKMNKFNSGLYFTRRQLEFFKLGVQPNQTPVTQDITSGERFLIYNVDQLEDPHNALATLQRSPVNVPTYLLSGEAIQHDSAKKFPKTFKSNYWLTGRDAELYQWAIKESEKRKGVPFSTNASSTMQIELYNVEQLTNPEEAFAKAGLFTQ